MLLVIVLNNTYNDLSVPKFSLMWPGRPKEWPTPALEFTYYLNGILQLQGGKHADPDYGGRDHPRAGINFINIL